MEDVHKILTDAGWHRYYSETHWVHEDICEFFDIMGISYYLRDYTNHQMTTEEAVKIYSQCQKLEN